MKPDELRALAEEVELGVFRDFELARAGFKRGSLTPTNLQYAVDAVPEGWDWERHISTKGPLMVLYHKGPTYPLVVGTASNPAAALCAAILRAKAAEMEGG